MSRSIRSTRERRLPHEGAGGIHGRGARRLAWRAAALAVAALLVPRAAAACSPIPTFSVAVVHPSTVAFLGRATDDTVRAGVGGVRPDTGAGHFGWSVAHCAVHGQIVQVERLAAGLPPDVAAAVRGAGDRVVLVPWAYGADCRPVRWAGSARWLPDTVGGLFQGTLRDREHWVGEMPTLDVHAPQFVPYTGTAPDQRRLRPAPAAGADSTLPLLTPGELLELRATLPTHDAAQADPDAAYAPLRAWAAAHPTLATREPARALIRLAEWTVADARFRRRLVPLAGTYRVTIWMADEAPGAGTGDSTTFYVRTEDHPVTPVGSFGNAAGMNVLACAAATEAALAVAQPWAGCGGPLHGATRRFTQGYLAFGDSAWTDGSGRTVRGGSVDLVHGDSAFQARFRQRSRDRNRDFPTGHPRRYLPGLFIEAADGGVSFTRTVEVADAPRLRITAERISATVIGQPPRQP